MEQNTSGMYKVNFCCRCRALLLSLQGSLMRHGVFFAGASGLAPRQRLAGIRPFGTPCLVMQ